MDKVTVYYDPAGRTLTVWFGDPHDEVSCDEVGDDVILMKDAAGQVIGVEKLNVTPREGVSGLTVEVLPAGDALVASS